MTQLTDLPVEVIRRIVKQDFDNAILDGSQRIGRFPHRLAMNRLLHHISADIYCQCAVITISRPDNPTRLIRFWSNMNYICQTARTRSVRSLFMILRNDPNLSEIYTVLTHTKLFAHGLPMAKSLIIDYRGTENSAQHPPQLYDALSSMLSDALPNICNLWFLGWSVGMHFELLLRTFLTKTAKPLETVIIDMHYINCFDLSLGLQGDQPGIINSNLDHLQLPRLPANELQALTIHSITTHLFWHRFYALPNAQVLEFSALRSLSLRFSSSLMTMPRLSARYQQIKFPCLTKLSLECSGFSATEFLEIFPRHQIQVLEVRGNWDQLDVSPFVNLKRLAIGDIPNNHPRWFNNSLCTAQVRLVCLEIYSLQSYDLPRLLKLPALAELNRLGIVCTTASTLIPGFLFPDALYSDGYTPLHRGIKYVSVHGPVHSSDINRRCIQQLVCLFAGLPKLQFLSLSIVFKQYQEHIRFEIKAMAQSLSLAKHVQHLHDISLQFQ